MIRGGSRSPKRKPATATARAAADSRRPAARERVADELRAGEVTEPEDALDLAPIVGANLRRLRSQRNLSLERLAKASGVSRAMLGQIELHQSTPTINVLWKIARALNVPFSALMSRPSASHTKVLPSGQAKVLRSSDGSFSSRALFPFDEPHAAEFYELRLAPESSEKAESHPPGTVENLVVTAGSLEMHVAGESHTLRPGDAIRFEADVPHEYRNPGKSEVVMYLVMTYAEKQL